jgi:lysozyme family protein
MSDDFEKSLKFVLEHETVYAKGHYGQLDWAISENEEGDSGGLTKFGIDQQSHPEVDIENLTVEEASLIYRREYWEKAHCYEMQWPLSQVQFDGAVNTGIGQQMKFLQRACEVNADGAWGPNTRRAMNEAVEQLGAVAVAKHCCDQKEVFYRRLVEMKPHTARFLKGWLNRLNDLRKDCGLA